MQRLSVRRVLLQPYESTLKDQRALVSEITKFGIVQTPHLTPERLAHNMSNLNRFGIYLGQRQTFPCFWVQLFEGSYI